MILVEGASGNAVRSLQRALNKWSEANKKGFKVQEDGTWGKGEEHDRPPQDLPGGAQPGEDGSLDGLTAYYLVGRYDPPDI